MNQSAQWVCCLLTDERCYDCTSYSNWRSSVICGAKLPSRVSLLSLDTRRVCVFGPRKTINYPGARGRSRRAYVVLFLFPNPHVDMSLLPGRGTWHRDRRRLVGSMSLRLLYVTGSRESLRFPDKRRRVNRTTVVIAISDHVVSRENVVFFYLLFSPKRDRWIRERTISIRLAVKNESCFVTNITRVMGSMQYVIARSATTVTAAGTLGQVR